MKKKIIALCILFAAVFLLIVPAIIPKGQYRYGKE